MIVKRPPNGAEKIIRLGVSPLSWVNEVLADLGEGTSIEQVLSEAKAAGFEGVEMSRIFPTDPAALTGLLNEHGLEFVSGWHSGFLAERSVVAEIEAVRPHASLLRACGADVMVYGECAHMVDDALDVPLARRRLLGGSEFSAYGRRLTEFAEILQDQFGLRLAYHHHLMMVAEKLDEVRALMHSTGSEVGLLLDTGHAAAAGFDYEQLIEEFGNRINHIHIKDVRFDVLAKVLSQAHSFNDGVRMGMFTVPGDGAVDYAPLAKFLGSGAYEGWVVVEAEQDPKKAQPAETVGRAFRFVTEQILQIAHA